MKNHIKNGAKYLVSLSLMALISACGVDGNTGANSVEDGGAQLVKATPLKDMNNSYMLNVLKASDINATNAFGYENAFGYKSVKITYNTVGEDDKPVVASGLLVIPTISKKYQQSLASIGKQYSVSMICDNHGTIFTNAEAPTNVEKTTFYPLAVSMSAFAGFAGIYPDYIGYGDSNGVAHPYILKKASARASVDMIKASMKYMEEHGIALNHQLYITGYSEGGYNAMALAQSIENGNLSTVNLMGVAPMAGPYNVEDLANVELNATHSMQYPAFLGYLADSYAFYYDDLNLSDIVVESNTTKFHALFNGDNNSTVIQYSLFGPSPQMGFLGEYNATKLFKTSFIDDYQTTLNAPIHERFRENNVDNWTPQSKMNLIQCVDDDIIPFSESNNTYHKFIASNASDVVITEINTTEIPPKGTIYGPFIHGRCAPIAYKKAIGWFNAIRNGDI